MAVNVAEVLIESDPRPSPISLEEQLAMRGLSLVSDREANVFNEYGIVEPPPVNECYGAEFHKEQTSCFLTRHHLHSTEPDYAAEGKLAVEFRDLAILTVWLPECAHKVHHYQYDIHVPIPHPKIMRRAKYEGGKVKQLVTNFRTNNNNDSFFNHPDLTEKDEKGLQKVRERLAEEREVLLEGLSNIEVIPERLVTGALLLIAPEVAAQRMKTDSDFVLPGVVSRAEVPIILERAQDILEEAA